jgi:ubiquitin-conjugating enzyme E2 variant
VHWFFDTYGSEKTPVFGPSVIAPFREHHTDQKAITYHNFLETNCNSFTLAVLVSIPAWIWIAYYAGPVSAMLLVYFMLVTWLTILANQVHKLAHLDEPGSIVRFLQKSGLILNPAHHARHHKAPFNICYCISSGFMNPLLDKIHFWRFLEHLFSLLGLKANRG